MRGQNSNPWFESDDRARRSEDRRSSDHRPFEAQGGLKPGPLVEPMRSRRYRWMGDVG
jgi:hypothetical protein